MPGMSEPRLEAALPSLDALPTSVLTRRTLLRTGALTGGGLVAAALAACTPAAMPAWTYAPPASAGAAPGPSAPSPSDSHASHDPGAFVARIAGAFGRSGRPRRGGPRGRQEVPRWRGRRAGRGGQSAAPAAARR